jgi:DNA (cytosine-5)-methyltransferase 1
LAGDSDNEGESVVRDNEKMARLPQSGPRVWAEANPEHLRVDDGVADRMDRFKALGNGQVPAVAALAWNLLKPTCPSPRQVQGEGQGKVRLSLFTSKA